MAKTTATIDTDESALVAGIDAHVDESDDAVDETLPIVDVSGFVSMVGSEESGLITISVPAQTGTLTRVNVDTVVNGKVITEVRWTATLPRMQAVNASGSIILSKGTRSKPAIKCFGKSASAQEALALAMGRQASGLAYETTQHDPEKGKTVSQLRAELDSARSSGAAQDATIAALTAFAMVKAGIADAATLTPAMRALIDPAVLALLSA